jgi:F-type H+-transporting ATPase subunit delta
VSYESVARRWAHALFEIGKESNTLPDLTKDVGTFAAVYAGSTELREVLDNPLVSPDVRENILRDLAQRLSLSETAKSTLRLLAQKRRLPALPEIARQLARLADDDANVVRATVTSARPLSEDYLGKLRAELEKATGKRISITHREDPSLIAGVVTQIGDQVIDGSVRARLKSLKDSLLRA